MRIIQGIMLLFVILLSTATSASAQVSNLTVSYGNGDEVLLKGTASPNEILYPSITFKETVNVGGNGGYSYQIGSVKIPPGKNNFAVTAESVKNLNIGVKLLIWWTRSADAVDGVARISQGNIPSGTYNVKIYGTAGKGIRSVPLTITASSQLTADEQGNFEYRYQVSGLPPGTYTLNIGGQTRTITLPLSKEEQVKENVEKTENYPAATATAFAPPDVTPEAVNVIPIIERVPAVTPVEAIPGTAKPQPGITLLEQLLNLLGIWR